MQQIRRGTILYRWFSSTVPPKSKFFVVIGENESNLVGFFFINSNISRFIKRNQSYFDMQMSIRKSDYFFLEYDSYIDAHEVKPIDKILLQNEITSNTTTIKGSLTEDDIELLLSALRNSKLFSKIEKETFFK